MQAVSGGQRADASALSEGAAEISDSAEQHTLLVPAAEQQVSQVAAQLQRAAEAALLGLEPQVPEGWLAAEATPTMLQLTAALDAAEAALEAAAVVAAQQGARPTKNYSVGLVCAALFGVQQLGRVECEAVGKRLLAASQRHQRNLKKVADTLKNATSDAKRRHKGDAAGLAAKLAALDAAAAAESASLCGRAAPFARQQAPPMAGGEASRALVPVQAAQEAPVSSAAEAALSLASLAHWHESPRAYSCANCAELLEAARLAREAAAAAEVAKSSAEQNHARAWAASQAAELEKTRALEALRREHAAELEHAQQRERAAAARAASKVAAKERQELERRAVMAEGAQHKVVAGTWQTVKELEAVKKQLAKAQAELRGAQAASDAAQEQLRKEHKREERKLEKELEKTEVELSRRQQEVASGKEQLVAAAQARAELERRLASEQVRRGIAEARVEQLLQRTALEAGSNSGTSNTRSRADAAANHGTISRLHMHIESRDAELKRLRGMLQRALLDEGVLGEELRQEERAVRKAYSPPVQQQQQQGRVFPARAMRTSSSQEAPMEPFTMELLRRTYIPACSPSRWACSTRPADVITSRSIRPRRSPCGHDARGGGEGRKKSGEESQEGGEKGRAGSRCRVGRQRRRRR